MSGRSERVITRRDAVGQNSLPRLSDAITPFVVCIPLCPATTSQADCNTRNAIDVTLGPEARNEFMCGLSAHEMFAQTAIRPRDGEYIKIARVHRKVVAEN